jgi:hypothetical protein
MRYGVLVMMMGMYSMRSNVASVVLCHKLPPILYSGLT